VLVSVVAYFVPAGFVWMKPQIPLLLGVIMLGMGMTLEIDDFRRVLQQPRLLGAGVAAQYLIMPLAGYLIARGLRLGPQLTAGFVLLGACPGGTASNVMAYLARADVGLSVSLTLCSTLLAPLFTPNLTWLYAHQAVEVNVLGLMKSVFWIVVFPLAGGLLLRRLLRPLVLRLLEFFPVISVVIICAVIGCVVALNVETIRTVSAMVAVAVVLHNACGLALGYGCGHFLCSDRNVKRTLAIEVGMQNSGLAVALATSAAAFGPLAALPGALFSLWHNLSGAALASYWARTTDSKDEPPSEAKMSPDARSSGPSA